MELIPLTIFSLVSLTVGLRLLARGLTEGLRPERLLGLHAVLITFGNAIVQVCISAGYTTSRALDVVIRLGGTSIDLGYLAFAFFCVEVYRPEAAWVKRAFLGVFGLVLVAQITSVALGVNLDPAFACQQLLRLPSYGWGTYEAFRFFAVMRRRARYGMGDPIVQERFLLWGLATGLALVILIALSVAFRLTPAHPVGYAGLTVGAVLAVPAAALTWISFFPPAWYRRRFAADAPEVGS